MIRSVCCVCGIQYGAHDDGKNATVDSHGYCQQHFDEAMIQIREQFPELPVERSAA